ncbi:CX3C chemokine receptor 1-like isoform X2 [Hemicordylus capensis]|uniref:CX3C chemokine receptor 1-like isoform X2 n=1 Tax=Hemicordylus capensis TaxID=884348 RepID=UPI00230271CE|nr:CX3C chemokine receptor 1-like isoform X2 [Hemicordylus capensis]
MKPYQQSETGGPAVFILTEEVMETTTAFAYEEFVVCDKMDIQLFGKVFLPALYALVFIVGLVGNLLVILTIMKGGRKKNITDIFLLNLAISDLLFVISLPFWGSYIVSGWTLGNLPCKIVASFYSVGFFGGLFFITVISIDRYLAIVRATFFMKARTVSHGFLTSLLVWSLAILFAAPQFVFVRKLEGTCAPQYPEALEKIWPYFSNIETNVIGFLLPMCIMSICYLRIIKTLLSCKNNRKKRAIRLILLVVIIFFIFWTPYHVSIFLHILRLCEFFEDCSTLRFLDYTMQVTEALAFSHCCLNPIIYAFAGEKFRKYISHLVLKCLSFICFCGPCSQYRGTSSITIPEPPMSSIRTQNTSEQDGSVLL